MIAVDEAEIDARLTTAEANVSGMATNLLALEETPAFTLIRHTSFTGETRAALGAALAGAAALWDRASAYGAVVAEARRLRDEQRHPSGARRQELERLLAGPVHAATTDTSGSGLTGRTIFGAGTGAVTLDQLGAELHSSYAAVVEAVRRVDAAWQDQLPMLQHLDGELRAAAADAAALGLVADRELGTLPERVHDALSAATTDPIGHVATTDQLRREVTALRDHLRTLARARDQLPTDLVRARQELVALQLLVARGADAAERARTKVKTPAGVRDPLDVAELDAAAPRGLGPELDRIEQAASGGWRAQRAALDVWFERARALRTKADAVVRANEAPVAARDELRGRLESYRAMAGAHGAAEDATLTELYERARAALHTAPADLRAAAPLVVQYMTAVRARAAQAGGQR